MAAAITAVALKACWQICQDVDKPSHMPGLRQFPWFSRDEEQLEQQVNVVL